MSKLGVLNEQKPWYSQGLRFKCTECGKCCTGAPGYVWISEEEITALASFLQLSLDRFSELYLRKVDGKWSLRENPGNFDCVFLKDKKCSVYQLRPKQCRTFPWWTQNLATREDWIQAAKTCEGIRHDAPVVSYDVIDEQLRIQKG